MKIKEAHYIDTYIKKCDGHFRSLTRHKKTNHWEVTIVDDFDGWFGLKKALKIFRHKDLDKAFVKAIYYIKERKEQKEIELQPLSPLDEGWWQTETVDN